MKKPTPRKVLGLLAIAALALLSVPAESQPVKAGYIYTLSGFTGSIPYNWSRVAVDLEGYRRGSPLASSVGSP